MNRKTFSTLYVCIVGLYVMFEWWSYSGLFKMLAETQLQYWGHYFIEGTLLTTSLIYAIPALIIGTVLKKDSTNHAVPENPLKLRKSAKISMLTGLIIIAVLIVAMFGVSTYWQDPILSTLVLGKDTEPKSSYVELKGMAQPKLLTSYQEYRNTSVVKYIIVPITSPEWKPGNPLQYFYRTRIEGDYVVVDFDESQTMHTFTRQEAPFLTVVLQSF